MLSIGFCFAIVPVAKQLYKNDIQKYNQFVKRHLNFFNGHPYFACYALGSVTRLEEEMLKGNIDVGQMEKFKNALIGPLGVLGDKLFWATILPASFTVGVLGFMIFENLYIRLTILILIGLLYNIPHFYIRISGMIKGYEQGFLVCHSLKMEKFSFIKNIYSFIGIVSLGLLIGWVMAVTINFNPFGLLVFASSIFTAFYLKSKLSKTYIAMMAPLVIAIIIGFIKNSV